MGGDPIAIRRPAFGTTDDAARGVRRRPSARDADPSNTLDTATTIGGAVVRTAATERGRAAGMTRPPTLNRVAESMSEAGRVIIQARPIFRTVSPWMPERLAHIVPATPE